jgi:N-[(2S)-2-amino-2-carboxyethyl]-L-glutamate dehydrogenase
MRYIRGADVGTCLRLLDPVDVVRRAAQRHANGQTLLPDEYGMRWKTPNGESARSLGLPAYLSGTPARSGVKIINANPSNVERGQARASGLIALFDPETAQIRTLLEGAQISALRTAAVTTVAAQILQGHAIERVALVGAGALGEAHLRLLAEHLPTLRTVEVLDLNKHRAVALCDRLHGLRPTLRVVDDAAQAARKADLIVLVTTATQPYLDRSSASPGAIFANVSLDDLDADFLLHADRLIVDDWKLVANDRHRMLGRLAQEGLVAGADESISDATRTIDAELADLVSGARQGRLSSEDVIVFNPFGMAIFDIAMAGVVEDIAVENGLGITLEV